MFGGLGLQGQPDGSSVSNIFEGPFTKEGTRSGKAILKGGFKFSASEARENFGSSSSSVHIEEDRYEFPSTQEYQNLEGKLKHDSNGGQLGSGWGAIRSDWGERI